MCVCVKHWLLNSKPHCSRFLLLIFPPPSKIDRVKVVTFLPTTCLRGMAVILNSCGHLCILQYVLEPQLLFCCSEGCLKLWKTLHYFSAEVGGGWGCRWSYLHVHTVPRALHLASHRPWSSMGTPLSGYISLKQTASEGSGPALGISLGFPAHTGEFQTCSKRAEQQLCCWSVICD